MGPGGSRSLQNCCAAASAVVGGFDSHTPLPRIPVAPFVRSSLVHPSFIPRSPVVRSYTVVAPTCAIYIPTLLNSPRHADRHGEHPMNPAKHLTLRWGSTLLGALLVMFVVVAYQTRPVEAAAASIYPSGSTGYDVSWPNCATKPPSHPRFGIVGVNDGAGYSQNPCLAKEAAWFPSAGLYVNTGWYNQSSHINPTSPKVCASGDENCLAYNYGYNAG